MPESLSTLEQQRSAILTQILELGDFRSGSITAISGRCGKPTCRCHQDGQSGHGPNYRLTRKVNGKTIRCDCERGWFAQLRIESSQAR
jgi:hypothetical protein